MDEEYIHNEEAGSTAEDFLIDHTIDESTIEDDISEVETADVVCNSCGGHEVSWMWRGSTEWDRVRQFECSACGATWED